MQGLKVLGERGLWDQRSCLLVMDFIHTSQTWRQNTESTTVSPLRLGTLDFIHKVGCTDCSAVHFYALRGFDSQSCLCPWTV